MNFLVIISSSILSFISLLSSYLYLQFIDLDLFLIYSLSYLSLIYNYLFFKLLTFTQALSSVYRCYLFIIICSFFSSFMHLICTYCILFFIHSLTLIFALKFNYHNISSGPRLSLSLLPILILSIIIIIWYLYINLFYYIYFVIYLFHNIRPSAQSIAVTYLSLLLIIIIIIW